MKTAVIIVAAGKGIRFGSHIPKQFLFLNKKPVLSYSLETFLNHPEVNIIQPVIDGKHSELYWNTLSSLGKLGKSEKILSPTLGGKERSLSVKSGLITLSKQKEPPDQVMIHDAARPLVSIEVIDRVLKSLSDYDAVFPVLPMVDAVWKVEKNRYELLKSLMLTLKITIIGHLMIHIWQLTNECQ